MKPTLGTKSAILGGIAGATTARTANIDCQGATYATIDVAVGVELNTNSTNVILDIKESDDTNGANFAAISSSFTNTTVDNTAATVATRHIDLDGRKRYLKVTVTPDTTTNGTVITAVTATLYKDVISTAATMLGPDVVVG